MIDGSLKLGGVPEHFNLPWHRAIESDACADLDVIWQDQHGGTGQMLAALEDGELDMVSILTEGTVSAIAKGASLTILQVYVTSPLQWGLFVPARSAHRDIVELERARIAVSRFTSGSHLMSFIVARDQGWTLSEDQFVVVGNLDGAVEAFAQDRADLFLWDRFHDQPAGRRRPLPSDRGGGDPVAVVRDGGPERGAGGPDHRGRPGRRCGGGRGR